MSSKLVSGLLLLIVPLALFGQDGKLRGRVTDKESGDPLIGANVTVEGTSRGATTDVTGDYIVLGLPAGVYSVRVSYIGYTATTITNLRVSANLTTTQDVKLASTTVQQSAVEIIAERPLIQRNTTNTVRFQTQEDIKYVPFRGLQNLIALNAGVVQQNGNLYVRGGRSGEVAYYVEGTNVTNPMTNGLDRTGMNGVSVPIIQEAIEEVQLQAGGYTAELGGSNSGIVRTMLRSGTADYHVSVNYQTDDFVKPGTKYLGGASYGFRNGVVTLSGPLGADNLKFFIAGQHNYIRDRNQRWFVPFTFENLMVDVNDPRYDRSKPVNQQLLLPGTNGVPGQLAFKENYVPGSWDQMNSGQGTIIFDFQPFKLRLAGSYSVNSQPNGKTWPGGLPNVFRLRGTQTNTNRGFGEVKLTHVLGATTFYEIAVSYQDIRTRTFDPEMDNANGPAPLALTVGGSPFSPSFKDNWNWYSDSLVSQSLGYGGFIRRYQGPNAWSTINGFGFADPNTPNNNYGKTSQAALGLTLDITSQVSPTHELKVGGNLTSRTVRSYAVNSISNAMIKLYGLNGNDPQQFNSVSDLSREISRTAAGAINYYGYDVFGNEVDGGADGAQKPFFASAYIQNKFEFNDLVLNVGARYEFYDTKAKVFPDPNDIDAVFDQTNDVIDYTKLVTANPFQLVLPRLSFSFPVSERTVFYAMYGKYAQLARLDQLYVGNTILSRTVSPISRGNAFLTPVGFGMKPERTTQYEIGFRQQMADNLAFTATGFYKDLKDLLSIRYYVNPNGASLYHAYLNEDFGTNKGLELTIELKRTSRLAARVNYTISSAEGTGSNSRSAQGAEELNIGIPSSFINPLDFNQTHRGTVMLDYRWDRGDGGPILEGLGVNALLSFNSGHGYTKVQELKDLGQSTAWNVGVYPLADPRFSHPAEPINASTTPWVFNIDLNISKQFWFSGMTGEVFVNVLNALNSKQVLYAYPVTGTPNDDGWLTNPLAVGYLSIPNYAAFYKAINLDNQWAWDNAGRGPTGTMFGTPRQVRVGLRVDI